MTEDNSNGQEGGGSSPSDAHRLQARGEGLSCNATNEDQPDMYFLIKRIRFLGKHVGILCQSSNGPCPLLSVINALILRGSVTIDSFRNKIGLREVQSLIAGYALSRQQENTEGAFQLDVLLNLIPKLQHGLDVNVQFNNGPQAFEFTEELEVFDAIAVTLRHGWLVDPQDSEVLNVIKKFPNYNRCVEHLLEYRAAIEEAEEKVGGDLLPPDNEANSRENDMSRLMREGSLIESFLNETASQLTYHGLSKLHSDVKEKEISVFFRNNHFTCMFMLEGRLYLLLTDCGYARLSNAVWELLSDIDGDTVLVNSDFVVEASASPELSGVEASGDADFLLAYQLQKENDAAPAGIEETNSMIGEAGRKQALTDEEVALALQQDFYEEASSRRNTRGSDVSVRSSRRTENRERGHPVHDRRRQRSGGCSVQ